MTKSRSSTGEASIVSISFTLVIIFCVSAEALLRCFQCRLSGLESLLSGLGIAKDQLAALADGMEPKVRRALPRNLPEAAIREREKKSQARLCPNSNSIQFGR